MCREDRKAFLARHLSRLTEPRPADLRRPAPVFQGAVPESDSRRGKISGDPDFFSKAHNLTVPECDIGFKCGRKSIKCLVTSCGSVRSRTIAPILDSSGSAGGRPFLIDASHPRKGKPSARAATQSYGSIMTSGRQPGCRMGETGRASVFHSVRQAHRSGSMEEATPMFGEPACVCLAGASRSTRARQVPFLIGNSPPSDMNYDGGRPTIWRKR